MLLDRLKYQKVQRPEDHELLATSSQELLTRNDFDNTLPTKSTSQVLSSDVLSRTSKDELPPYLFGQKSWKKAGWRVGASLAACSALFALITNITTAIWVSKTKGTHGGMSTIYIGDCKRVETMDTWIHLAINALSTLLLSGSNYCMQCLSAPTRAEVDAAHARKKWLDIGVPSIRNLRNIDRKRVFLWWCLGLSSVPLHLIYNSVFFSAIATNDYNYLYAAEGFARGAWFNETQWPSDSEFNGAEIQKQAPNYQNLTNIECINAYATDFISDRRTLILVIETDSVNGTKPDGSLIGVNGYSFANGISLTDNQYDPYSWMCSSSNWSGDECYKQIPGLLANLTGGASWQLEVGGPTVKYCLSEQVEESCSLHFSLALILVVIVCNMGKLTAMSIIIFRLGDSKPLVTVGDAVDSFLRDNDSTTRAMCLSSWKRFDKYDTDKKYVWPNYEKSDWRYPPRMGLPEERPDEWPDNPKPTAWVPKPRKWAHAASTRRWCTCITLFVIAIIIVVALLADGVSSVNGSKNIQSLWRLGFGAVHANALIHGWSLPSTGGSGLIASVLVGNLPQPILSFLYLIFNGLCTCMLLADEWGRFGREKKSLRVSIPRGQQRSTYFLQLPYRWGIPLVVMSGILHWLVSQSIFLANVTIIDRNGTSLENGGVTTCGYSPMAIIFTLIVGSLLFIGGIGIGQRRLNPDMPVAASCSAAISAACHGLPGEKDASFLPIQWGAVMTDLVQADDVGHCCFSIGKVVNPVEGRMYAAGMGMCDDHSASSAVELG